MSHVDPEVLALLALGETSGRPQDGEHVPDCPDCREDLRQLASVVSLARSSDGNHWLIDPPAGLWARIAAEAELDLGPHSGLTGPMPLGSDLVSSAETSPGTDPINTARTRPGQSSPRLNRSTAPPVGASPAKAAPAGPAPASAPPGRVPQRSTGSSSAQTDPGRGKSAGRGQAGAAAVSRGQQDPPTQLVSRQRRPWWQGPAVAAVLALVVGAGLVLGVQHLRRAPAPSVIASIALRPLAKFPQWKNASGTAVMESDASGRQLEVRLRAPARSGFYEVWLLAKDGVKMISLGDLDHSQDGVFTLPPGVDLGDYSRIDVSLQPFNGNPVHSRTSVVRGTLP
ncbi:MAG: anti-sigma factor [Actinomycetota bacterium]